MNEYTKVSSIEDLNSGVVNDLFTLELERVLANIADENTPWKTTREISIKVKIELSGEERESATTTIEVKSKLAAPKPHAAMIYLQSDGRAIEAMTRKNDPVQQELNNIRKIEEAR